MNNKERGFTLIEVLITMAIFSIIAVISYSALNASLKNEVIQKSYSERLTQLQSTLLFLQRDITQINKQQIEIEQFELSFDSMQNDQLLLIKYTIEDGQLIRTDQSDEQNSIPLILIDKITGASIRALDGDNQWKKYWQPATDKYLKAIEIKFDHPQLGIIKKLVMIRE